MCTGAWWVRGGWGCSASQVTMSYKLVDSFFFANDQRSLNQSICSATSNYNSRFPIGKRIR